MRFARMLAVCSAVVIAPAAVAQKWELGAGAGGGFYTSQDVEHPDGTSAKAKIETNVAVSGWLAHNNHPRWGGEIRYSYQRGDLKLEQGSTEAKFGGEAHAIHYDFLWHAADRGSAVRPYVAFGGGIKIYRGTGEPVLVAPLERYALLSPTQELQGMVSVGAGIKMKLSPRWQLRVDVHDYLTPFPKEVITPNPPSKVSGWIHDIVPMFGLSYTSAN
jgi:hypothetical protein